VDVTTETFELGVIERSAHAPVLVDFWAAWCQPCTQLTPVLEAAIEGRGVVLAKVDVDAQTALAERYQVSGIPAVKAFRNGEVVAEFVGVRGRPALDSFIDELTRPPLADSLDDDEEVAGALRRGDYEGAFETLLARAADPARRERARELMVGLFNELGQAHPLSTSYRKRLAALLY
jgi:putative thioredoxin